jgi:mRNA-degrading endonuclease RelE of RelBE toxin-antitoxin system
MLPGFTDGPSLLRFVKEVSGPDETAETKILKQLRIVELLLQLEREKTERVKIAPSKEIKFWDENRTKKLVDKIQKQCRTLDPAEFITDEEGEKQEEDTTHPERSLPARKGEKNQKRLHSRDIRLLFDAFGTGPASLLQHVQDISVFYKHAFLHQLLLRCILETIPDQRNRQDACNPGPQPDSSKRPSTGDNPHPSKKPRVQEPLPSRHFPPHTQEAFVFVGQTNPTKSDSDVTQIWRWPTMCAILFLGREWTTMPNYTDDTFDYYGGIPLSKIESLPNARLLSDMQQSRQWKVDPTECLVIGLQRHQQLSESNVGFCTIFAITGYSR